MHLARAIDSATHVASPWSYFQIVDALPDDILHSIWARDWDFPHTIGKQIYRRFALIDDTPVGRYVADPVVLTALENRLGVRGRPSVRLVLDEPGHFSRIHKDSDKKVGTLQIYLSGPKGQGTVIYDRERKRARKLPFLRNHGWFFANDGTTWHAVDKVKARRFSLIMVLFK